MRVAGALAAFAYRLSRHRFLRLPLDVAVVAATALLLGYGAVRCLLGGVWPVSPWLAGALALWSGISLSLRARSFILFREDEPQAAVAVALPPFRKVPVRGTGVFEVAGARRHFVQAAGTIEATELGERIMAVKVQSVSVIGLLHSPHDEWGHWYAFFRPEELSSAVRGRLYFGRRAWPALCLSLHGRSLILSFADSEARDLVAADLSRQGGEPAPR